MCFQAKITFYLNYFMKEGKLTLPLLSALLLSACSVVPKGEFQTASVPPKPDYNQLINWAAHPDKVDLADKTPTADLKNRQSESEVDVFFLHPTTYYGHKAYQRHWNARMDDQKTNKSTDEGSIQFQASIFNGTGRIYAPRYRQANLNVFFNKKKKESGVKALALAHEDAVAAFEYYLQHWNQGRPFILAGHSQGAYHIMTLIKEKIEGTP